MSENNGNGRGVPLWIVLVLLSVLGGTFGLLYKGVADRSERAEQKVISVEAAFNAFLPQILERLRRIEDKLDQRVR